MVLAAWLTARDSVRLLSFLPLASDKSTRERGGAKLHQVEWPMPIGAVPWQRVTGMSPRDTRLRCLGDTHTGSEMGSEE
jgi:hypothetical protein